MLNDTLMLGIAIPREKKISYIFHSELLLHDAIKR